MRSAFPVGVLTLSLAAALAGAAEPRIAPVQERDWTAVQRELVSTYAPAGAPRNDLKTLLVHPALAAAALPFYAYTSSGSTLPARDREMLILRTAWLSRSEYVWASRAATAARAGLSAADLTRIGAGPRANGWSAFDAALLQAADELHEVSFVSDATWMALSGRYSTPQLMDAVFTVAEFSMWAMTMNSAGVALDAPAPARFPTGAARVYPSPRRHAPLTTPRIPALEPAEWTPAVRAMLDPSGSGRPVAAVYRTYAQHPALYAPRQILSEYIRTGATLSPRVREMLILRIGYLCQSAYEWAAHARAGKGAGLSDDEIRRIADGPAAGWSADDAALLQAVDDLFERDRVSDETWSRLAARFDQKQLLDVLITAGGYRMVSMSLNSFGVPLEPNSEPLPSRR